MIEYTKVNPCIQAKLAIEWEPFQDRAHAQQVAIALEEMLQAVEKGQEDFTLASRYEPRQLINSAVRQREELEERYRKREEERDKKRE